MENLILALWEHSSLHAWWPRTIPLVILLQASTAGGPSVITEHFYELCLSFSLCHQIFLVGVMVHFSFLYSQPPNDLADAPPSCFGWRFLLVNRNFPSHFCLTHAHDRVMNQREDLMWFVCFLSKATFKEFALYELDSFSIFIYLIEID